MQVNKFGGTFDQLYIWIFFTKLSQKMPLDFFYTIVQKSQKWPKTQIKGSCFKCGFAGIAFLPKTFPANNWSIFSGRHPVEDATKIQAFVFVFFLTLDHVNEIPLSQCSLWAFCANGGENDRMALKGQVEEGNRKRQWENK